jgi:hypothetical protein
LLNFELIQFIRFNLSKPRTFYGVISLGLSKFGRIRLF